MNRHTRNGLDPPKGTLNEARWWEILQVAEDALFEKGYKDTTVEEIAARVGLLKGSLYYYIENKEDLLYQVVTRLDRQHLRELQDDPGVNEGDAISRLSGFIDRHMQLIERKPERNRISELRVFLNSDRLASLNAIYHDVQLILREIVAQGVEEGTFDPGTDPSVAANSVLALMNGSLRWFRPHGRCSFREIGEWYKGFILKGLQPATGVARLA